MARRKKKKSKSKEVDPTWRMRVKKGADGERVGICVADKCAAGTVMAVEAPFAWVPHPGQLARVCSHCGSLIHRGMIPTLVRCLDGCHSVYCNPQCEALDNHAVTCAPVAIQYKAAGVTQETVLGTLILKLLLSPEAPGLRPGLAVDGVAVKRATQAHVAGLTSHRDATPDDVLTHAAERFRAMLADEAFAAAVGWPTESHEAMVDAAVTLVCQVNVNSHAVRPAHRMRASSVGTGLFPHLAMLNHSCDPNCVLVGHASGALVLRTIKTVSSGEELTIAYTDVSQPASDRAADLLMSRRFSCSCPVCANAPASDGLRTGYLCPRCPAPSPDTVAAPDVPALAWADAAWTCATCGDASSEDELAARTAPLDALHKKASDLARAQLFHDLFDTVSEFETAARAVLHPCHAMHEMMCIHGLNASNYTGNTRKALHYALRLVEVSEALAPDYDVDRDAKYANALQLLGTTMVHLRNPPKRDRALKAEFRVLHKRAVAHARVLFGPSGPRTLELEEMATAGWRPPAPTVEQPRRSLADLERIPAGPSDAQAASGAEPSSTQAADGAE